MTPRMRLEASCSHLRDLGIPAHPYCGEIQNLSIAVSPVQALLTMPLPVTRLWRPSKNTLRKRNGGQRSRYTCCAAF